jgi:hypothetical protein
MRLTPDIAARLMDIALGHVAREYPHKLDHILSADADAATPRSLHPIFFGSFDWHSCVHGWWTLLTCARTYPTLSQSVQVRDLAIATFTADNVAAEVDYLRRPGASGFERPYGWAWLLTLHAEMLRHRQAWANALDPLAAGFARAFHAWLPRATYPVRTGSHGNTAFALIHAHAWATRHDPALALALTATARRWYSRDTDAAVWEPDGDAFLSPVLTEAHCMLRLLPRVEFDLWFDALFPMLDEGEPALLFEPPYVSDRSDGKIAHLDGLALSRAWSWRALGDRLPLSHVVHAAAERHLAAAMPHLADDYAGEHWLASFALLALLPDSPDTSA